MAALQVHALPRNARRRPVPKPEQYFRKIAEVIDPAWQITIGADLANPGVAGNGPLRYGWQTPTSPDCTPQRPPTRH